MNQIQGGGWETHQCNNQENNEQLTTLQRTQPRMIRQPHKFWWTSNTNSHARLEGKVETSLPRVIDGNVWLEDHSVKTRKNVTTEAEENS
jgi:hypothetical protein